jgi:hypothetical protein
MSIAYPQKVSSEQPFPVVEQPFPVVGRFLAVDFRWCLKSFPLRGAPRGFEGSLYGCSDLYCPGRGLSPNGDRYIHIGSSQGAALDVCDDKIFLLHNSTLKEWSTKHIGWFTRPQHCRWVQLACDLTCAPLAI